MNKNKVSRFIDKYYLSGNVASVVLTSKGDTLSTRFITGDKSLLGELSMNSWNFEDVELGVYNTEQLIKLLDVLSDDVEMKLTKAGDKAISLEVTDGVASVNYMLSDLSVINQPPKLKKIPEFHVKVKVDSKFIQKFISGKSALADTDSFTVITNSDGVKVVIGYSSINTNRVTIPVETDTYEEINKVSFNANLFRDVLSANKECESAVLEVSGDGLARINFKIDNYNATYYLVALQSVD
jgi:hypothetical protein|tara:strand:+ start:2748 stop:3467 length:720 start_codon:yes stop_codon:yes gene_type:complete